MYSELYHKAYTAVLVVYPTVSRFPKSQRSVLSARIENTTLEILELVIELECKNSKIHRRKILIELQKLQTLLRISKDLSFLDFKKYEYMSSLVVEMRGLLNNGGALSGLTEICMSSSAPFRTCIWHTGKRGKEKHYAKMFSTFRNALKRTYCSSSTSLKLLHTSRAP